MPQRATLTLVDALADEATRIGSHASDDALRAQAAFVRAVLDEVGRFHPSDRRVAPLHEQLGEELSRLARMAVASTTNTEERSPLDVLVVDDEPAALEALARVVRTRHCCRTAASADEAIGRYRERPAAILISDQNLPGMSGLELCRTLKARDHRLYVLLVTAHEDACCLEGVRGGVDDFMQKPIDIDELAIRLGAAERLVRAVRIVQAVGDALRAR